MDDAAITKDGSRVVAVATLELTTSGLSPSKLTPEKRLLGSQRCPLDATICLHRLASLQSQYPPH